MTKAPAAGALYLPDPTDNAVWGDRKASRRRPRHHRLPVILTTVVGLVLAGLGWTFMTVSAGAADVTLRFSAAMDTTASQVSQDGNGATRKTLATCPAKCEGNSAGRRVALLDFAVRGLPSDAVVTSAKLEVTTWSAADAAVSAHSTATSAKKYSRWADLGLGAQPVHRRTSLTKGVNSWNVTSLVKGNGTVTVALAQSSRATRVYWAAAENGDTARRPRLVVAYRHRSAPAASATKTSKAPAAAPSNTRTSSPSAPAGWRLVWSDEFNGTSLDTSRWKARNNTYLDYDQACITNRPENVQVSGGHLLLRARKENFTCGSQKRSYTAAYLDTIGKAQFTYGRFEMRAQSPGGPKNSTGLWPAFWLRPQDGGNGEIDVVELPGGSSYYRASTASIFRDYSPTKQDYRYTFPEGYPGDGFHTYTTEWDKNYLKWYVDGVLVYQRTTSTTSWFSEVFRKPYHLRLNYQVGGKFPGSPTSSTSFPSTFAVDYVRVWQR